MTKPFRDILHDEIGRALHENPDVIVLGENVRTWGGSNQVLQGLTAQDGGERIRETPVAENLIVGASLGAALMGMRPIAEIYSADFLFTAGNEVINDIPKWRYQHRWRGPLCVILRMAMGASQEGKGPEHSQCIEGYLHHVPGLTVVVPGDGQDIRGCLRAALAGDDPVIFLEHRRLYPVSVEDAEGPLTAIGQARVLRNGCDITLVAWGWMRYEAMAAADQLEEEGFSVELIDPVTIKPLDFAAIRQSIGKTHRLLVVEEGPITGSIGSEILARMAEQGIALHGLGRLAMPDEPIAYHPTIEAQLVPNAHDIIHAVKKLCA